MSKRLPPISSKLPVMMHGADYNPDQWLDHPAILQEDIRLMKLAGCNVVSVGMFSWASMEPEEGKFTFEWLDKLLDSLEKNGIHVWLSTPSGARPAWMSQKYPEILRVDRNRVRILHGKRHNHCYSSPIYREKTAMINRKLAERYRNHPAVVGWHISNEYGGECHCDLCQEVFRAWLKERYGTLEQLNRAWWTTFWSHTYTSWSQIESPAPHGENGVHALNLDWRRFVTARTVDFCRHEITAVQQAGSDLPVTTNFYEHLGALDFRQFGPILDVMSWDAYQKWHKDKDERQVAAQTAFIHDLFRSIKRQPFLLMESTPSTTNWQPVSKLKRPNMHKLSSLQAVAHGSDSVQYFQWRKSRGSYEKFHGAVVDHVGHEHTRVFKDVAELGDTLAKLSEIVGTTTPARVAILFDWDNLWAVEDSQGPRNCGVHFIETVQAHYYAFWQQGVSVDIIGAADDFSSYKLIVAPMLYLCREETGRKLEQFVEKGGSLVTTYWSGIVNETDLCYLNGFPGPLRKLLGVWAEEIDGLYDEDSNEVMMLANNAFGLNGTYEAHELCELIHLEGAEVLGQFTEDFYAGRPALTVNNWGNGKAYYMAARLKADFLHAFYKQIVELIGVSRAINTELPASVNVQVRTDGSSDYLFVMNFSEKAQRITLDQRSYTELETGKPVQGELELAAYDVSVLKRQV